MMLFIFMGCSDKGLSSIPLYIINFFRISAISGSGSAGRRKILVLHLLRSCRETEIKFLVRTLVSIHSFLLCTLQFLFEAILHVMVAGCTLVPCFWS